MALSAGVAPADETGIVPPVLTPMDVTVLGRVQHAGHYRLAAGARLSAAIAAAGGERPAETAFAHLEDLAAFVAPPDERRVFLMRTVDGQRITYQINVDRTPYDVRYDPLLRSGDTIFIPELRKPGFKVISALAA
jgi:protein involved in polysaccharide export with SLBB domain